MNSSKYLLHLFLCSLFLWGNVIAGTAQEDTKITAVYNRAIEKLTLIKTGIRTMGFKEGEIPPQLFDAVFNHGNRSGYAVWDDKAPYMLEINVPIGEMDRYGKIVYYFVNSSIPEFDENNPFNVRKSISVEIKDEPEEEKGIMLMEEAHSSRSLSKNERLLLVAIGVIILAFIIFFAIKRRKRKKSDEKVPENTLFEVVEEEDNNYEVGLSYIKKEAKNYCVIDAQKLADSTAVHKIYIHRMAIKKMYDYFKKFMENPERTNETGCYFVGCWEYDDPDCSIYNISLEEIVEPGDDMIPGEFSFSFGKKIGINLGTILTNLSEKTNRDYVLTTWMHSHPGLGLFLSNHDLVVQRQLVYHDAENRMLAIVIDTNTPDWQMAFFTPKTDGSMNNKDDIKGILSLDTLYEWSRSTQNENISFGTSMINYDNYFHVLNHKEGIRNVYITGKAINEMDDIFYAGDSDLIGFFDGQFTEDTDRQEHVIIENCSVTDTGSMIGCFITDSYSPYPDLLQKYASIIEKYRCFIVYRTGDELWIAVKDQNGNYPLEQELIIASLKQMKEWTRRRRI